MATHADIMETIPAAPRPAAREALEMLASRRSPAPDTLVAPAPGAEEIETMLRIATRVPDHGRIAPWRLILIAGEAKANWLAKLMEIAESRDDAPKARVSARKLASAPLVVVLVSSPTPGHKIPEWEQQLSAGAVGMNLLHAAHALGYGANWLTGWHAYDPAATALLGLGEQEKVAAVMPMGTVAQPTAERERPDTDRIATWLEL
ncbi:MAG: nitroreductase family protein [Pseudomonadota bacterium]